MCQDYDRETDEFYFTTNLIQVTDEDGRLRTMVVRQKKHRDMQTCQKTRLARQGLSQVREGY